MLEYAHSPADPLCQVCFAILDFPLNCLILFCMSTQRLLTHDEKKASEAAFRGLPLDDNWTDSAKSVYEGIIQALGKTPLDFRSPLVIHNLLCLHHLY